MEYIKKKNIRSKIFERKAIKIRNGKINEEKVDRLTLNINWKIKIEKNIKRRVKEARIWKTQRRKYGEKKIKRNQKIKTQIRAYWKSKKRISGYIKI